jgi:hypothetical protein
MHRFRYDEQISVESCAQCICDVALNFGEGRKKSMVLKKKAVV